MTQEYQLRILPEIAANEQRLKEYICHIDSAMMKKVDEAICVSLNLPT